ncbi:MAG: hypothetical protein U0167_16915 [bacterium]
MRPAPGASEKAEAPGIPTSPGTKETPMLALFNAILDLVLNKLSANHNQTVLRA